MCPNDRGPARSFQLRSRCDRVSRPEPERVARRHAEPTGAATAWTAMPTWALGTAPLLVVHGTSDKSVPLPHGLALFEAAAEPTFAEPETIELTDGQAEYAVKPSGDHPYRFFRLRSR